MKIVVASLISKACLVYLDNTIIVGNDLDSYNNNLIQVFNKIGATNLKVSLKKYYFLNEKTNTWITL